MWNLERFALMFTILDSSHHENYLKHIFEMGVNRKFDFRWDWKFSWDFSNVFLGGTLYLSTSYSFKFSQVNSLLSWAFSRQDKKMKIIGIINGSVTCTSWLCSFFVLILSVLFTIEPINFKKTLTLEFLKNIIKVHNQTMLHLMK